MTVSLAACSTSTAPAGESSAPAAADDAAFPIEIEHALGTTTIEAQPERVVSIGWANQDVALALGVAPVGVDDQTWSMDGSDGLGLYEWTTDAYEELGAEEPDIFDTTDGVDFEAIADAQPDVILGAYSGLTEDDYATLSEIAPTVAFPELAWGTQWRDAITLDATALGLASEGEQLIADLDQQIADATADSDFSGKTAALFSFSAADLSSGWIYSDIDPRTAFLTDLGFTAPEASLAAGAEGEFALEVSAENADQLADVDVIVSYGDEDLLAALQADPLWNTLPAVQNGAVVTLGGNGEGLAAASSPTALSIPWMLDEYVGLLDDAVAKAE
ncbi:iron-siderophore ABC transporter substrate-binding protein [Microbacterium marinilacus]|nr:iron-siderophore ABC transporter substrate-binding protein [Microbacterium marinilacus]